MKYLYEAVPSAKEGESGVYRSHFVRDQDRPLRYDAESNAATVYDVIQHSIATFRDKEVFGYRDILETYKEEKVFPSPTGDEPTKKVFTLHKLSPYRWLTYHQMGEMLSTLSSAFCHIGVQEQEKVTFYAPSSHYWLILAYSLFYRNAAVATVYDTLGEEGLLHGMNQCESRTLYITSDQLPILRKVHSKATSLSTVIYTGDIAESEDLAGEFPNLKFYSWDQLMAIGKANPSEPKPPKEEDLAVVMYTSGSTGPPKGALLTHAQLSSHVAGINVMAKGMIYPDDVLISFLPLAHILAFILITYTMNLGVRLGFATPRTLMDASVRNCQGDLKELRPTVLPGVPQIFDTIRKGVLNKVNASGPVASAIFAFGMAMKNFFVSLGLPTGWIDTILFKKVAEATGGRLRMGVCGGAPLSGEVAEFFQTTMFPIYQAYGMTEMSGMGSLVYADSDMPRSSVGQINPAMEVKIVDVPDAGYFSKDNVGELWVRGPCITPGYFKNKEATDEAIEDGWLKTGDIVRISPEGCLTIIDRRKNLVKLANGEYIALEKLEAVYRNSLYIQSVCLFADSHLRNPVAIIQANLPALICYANNNNLPTPDDLSDVSGKEDYAKEVLKSCLQEAKKAGLNSSEKLAGVFLAPMEFTVDSGLLTPSQKLNRRGIQQKFRLELDNLFKACT